MKLPPHICFDFDGTIVEQGEGYYAAIVDVFSKRELTPPPRDLWNQAQWKDDFSLMHSYGSEQDLWFEITDLYCARHDRNVVFEGALNFLDRCRNENIKMSLATGRTVTLERLNEITDHLGITHYFDVMITHGEMGGEKVVQAADVDKKLMFELVCREVEVPIDQSWYITDIARDADNAIACGFQKVVGVTTGGINPALFSKNVVVVNDLEELKVLHQAK